MHASLVPELQKVGKACSVTHGREALVLRPASCDTALRSVSVMVSVLKSCGISRLLKQTVALATENKTS